MTTRQPLATTRPGTSRWYRVSAGTSTSLRSVGDLLREPMHLVAAICRINGGNLAAIQRGRTE